jgi:hypothetical protein
MKEARRHFSVGNDLYKDGRFEEALAEFDVAYRLSGRATALLNVGDCQRQLDEHAAAYDTYQAILTRHGAQLSAADRTAVQRAIEYLDGHTGLLAVTTNVDGAEILADGRVVGRAPLAAPLRLDIGSHTVTVRKEGFVPHAPPAVVEILSKQLARVDATLVAEVVTGHLSVREQSARDVHVLVDGTDEGPAPWEGDLEPGSHLVEARGDRFVAEPRPIELVKGQRLDLVLAAEPTVGRLRIASPAGATIAVDHRQVGVGSWEGEVAPGPHHIEVALGDQQAARDVVIERGATVVQEIPLAAASEKRPGVGLYGSLAAMLPFGVTSAPNVHAVAGAVDVHPGGVFGFGALLHAGYGFGVFSAELTGAFLFTHQEQDTSLAKVTVESDNGFFGPGARVTTRHAPLRFTGGLALGAAVRGFTADRQNAQVMGKGDGGFHASAGYVDPGLVFDAAVMLDGWSGTRFFLGLVTWLDLPSRDAAVGPDTSPYFPNAFFSAPGRGYLLASGPQVLLGPTLGVQLGPASTASP